MSDKKQSILISLNLSKIETISAFFENKGFKILSQDENVTTLQLSDKKEVMILRQLDTNDITQEILMESSSKNINYILFNFKHNGHNQIIRVLGDEFGYYQKSSYTFPHTINTAFDSKQLNSLEYNDLSTFENLFLGELKHSRFIEIVDKIILIWKQIVNKIIIDKPTIWKKHFATRLIIRLILLEFLQARNLLKEKFTPLSKFISNNSNSYQKMISVFEQLSGLQKAKDIPDSIVSPDLLKISDFEKKVEISNHLLIELCKEIEEWIFLYEVDGSINIGALDPEFLGIIYEKLLSETEYENKNFRQKTGSYYTPYEITYEVSRECVHARIKNEIHQEHEVKPNSLKESLDALNIYQMKDFYFENLRNIKILDPAVGSGTFLLASLNVLKPIFYCVLSRLKEELSKSDHFDDLKKFKEMGIEFVSQYIISNCLYGVDLYETSVEVCKLRLYLSYIYSIDLKSSSINSKLLNLNFKQKRGNSLIGYTSKVTTLDDFLDSTPSKNDKLLIKKITQYHVAKTLREKNKLIKEIYLNKQKWDKTFLRIMQSTLRFSNEEFDKFTKTGVPFNWITEFPEIMLKDGFDVILGNPPYSAEITQDEKKIIKATLGSQIGKEDYFLNFNTASLFILRSLELLNDKGICGLIVPKSLCYIKQWEHTRKSMLEHSRIFYVRDLQEYFDKVQLEQVAIAFGNNIKTSKIEIVDNNNRLTNQIESHYFTEELFPISINNHKIELHSYIESKSTKIGNHIEIINGLNLNRYVQNKEARNTFKVLRGKDIQRYLDRDLAYLNKKFVDLETELIKYSRTQIVIQRIIAHIKNPIPHIKIVAAEKKKDNLFVNTLTGINNLSKEVNISYLITILNSSIISWYAYNFIYSNAIRSMDLRGSYLTSLPLIVPHKNILNLIDTIYSLLKCEIQNHTNFELLKTVLDLLIFEIYVGEIFCFSISQELAVLLNKNNKEQDIIVNLKKIIESENLAEQSQTIRNNPKYTNSQIYLPFFNH